jgi:Lrp/AsnC family transcriptional regulator for asnA, asnC and gidA
VVPAGRFDIMAELVCRDGDELVRALGSEIGAIAGIDTIETFLYLRLLYTSTAGAWGVGRSIASPHATGVLLDGERP